MPIRIQLWKGDTQIGSDALYVDPGMECSHSVEADRHVDRIITAIHRGEHGNGDFRIECDRVNKHGLYVGQYYACKTQYPKAQSAPAHAFRR